ncbi:hypothetical protein [Nocardioides cavernaquae]|uniref:Uncharacterized protein n=1 Tax=Nocardioides cavernaquae TaxID=2321396 RepID=A0A3A5H3F6_9ACTN|nr:hypothetical protein [Nocardioides cavernaquae]RJS45303.1 hypothetical protein D4739_03105 [Nocardioides cavernaquae]
MLGTHFPGLRFLALPTLLGSVAIGSLSACGVTDALTDPVAFTSTVEPVDLQLAAPTLATAVKGGLLLRSGKVERTIPHATSADWLPGGRALVRFDTPRTHLQMWDPATDSLSKDVPLLDPNRSVSAIAMLGRSNPPKRKPGDEPVDPTPFWDEPYRLTTYDVEGREQWHTDLPLTDNPDADKGNELERSYLTAHVIDGATFLAWHDGSEYYEFGDYGLLRVGPGGKGFSNTFVGDGLKSMWLSADGASLLATRRPHGKPCGGCQVKLELIEIDPATGKLAADYGMPDGYTKDWDVLEVDKVGDRVAISFTEAVWENELDFQQTLRGTWVHDADGWSMVPGSDKERSWWQGPDDRVVAVPSPPTKNSYGEQYRYFWEHDGKRAPLTGATTSGWSVLEHYAGGESERMHHGSDSSVPGQLLPPAR